MKMFENFRYNFNLLVSVQIEKLLNLLNKKNKKIEQNGANIEDNDIEKDVEKPEDKDLELKKKWDQHVKSLRIRCFSRNATLLWGISLAIYIVASFTITICNKCRPPDQKLKIDILGYIYIAISIIFLVCIGFNHIRHMKGNSFKEFKNLHFAFKTSPSFDENECSEEIKLFKNRAEALKVRMKHQENIHGLFAMFILFPMLFYILVGSFILFLNLFIHIFPRFDDNDASTVANSTTVSI